MSGSSEGVKNGKGRLQSCNQYGSIEVTGASQWKGAQEMDQKLSGTHPMANVLQSAAGASAVMGSKMVLAERCSDVEGSKSMMLP